MKKLTVLLTMLVLMSTGISYAKDLDVSVDLTSKYIWRGMDLLSDNNPAIQPSITYNFKDTGLSVNLWCSFALGDRNIHKYVDEIDLTLAYAFSASEDIDISVGFLHYGYYFAKDFNFKDNSTQEVYVTATFKNLPLSPYISFYYDFNLGDGFYILAGASHSVEVAEGYNLDLSATLGYNGKQYINKSGMSDMVIGASMNFKIGSTTLTPYIKYASIFKRELNPKKSEIWFGGIIAF